MISLRTIVTCIVYYILSTQNGSYAETDYFSLKSWWPSGEFSVLQKMFDDCARNPHAKDSTFCIKNKIANAIERALAKNISITRDLVLVRNANAAPDYDSTVTDPEERVARTLKNLVNTHTFRVDLTKSEEGVEEEESRGDKGGYGGYGGYDKKKKGKGKGKDKGQLMYAKMLIMGLFGQLALKVIALLALKALTVSKIALILSVVLAISKLFKGEKKESATFQVHTVPEHHYGRNFQNEYAAKSDVNNNYPYIYSAHQQNKDNNSK